jgi:hypothetical protein
MRSRGLVNVKPGARPGDFNSSQPSLPVSRGSPVLPLFLRSFAHECRRPHPRELSVS